MKLFEVKRDIEYNFYKDDWTEYINISEIEGIIAHLIKNHRTDKTYKNGYDVLMRGGQKIWITDDELIQLRKMINEN